MNGKQRYRCNKCGYHFTDGDGRVKGTTAVKKALAIMLYTTARTSFRRIGKILDVDHSLVYRWIREAAENLPEPTISEGITEIELDEMWHFIKNKKTNSGLSKQLTVVQGEPLRGLQVAVILKQSENFTKNSLT
jgi:transposase-like protein